MDNPDPASELIPITQAQVASLLPRRPRDSHKGLFGTVGVIGGSTGMIGAPLLAARAALKLGAGCVHVSLLADNAPVIDLVQPELMVHPPPTALLLPHANVLAIGCGMGHDGVVQKLVDDAVDSMLPLVLDAGALTLLAQHPELRERLRTRSAPGVITPHPGEAARLLATTPAVVQADRVAAVRQLADQLGCSVVLKGVDSLCATRSGKIYVNHTGNPGMSSAGMGDVLAGMIAAFIAQGLSPDDALLLGVHLHGAAGDTLAEQKAAVGMTATEVTDMARWLLNRWIFPS